MNRGIYLLRGQSDLVAVKQRPFASEDELQTLISLHPELLGGEQMSDGTPRRFLLLGREVPIPDAADHGGRWSADHLFVDQDAVLTIVEVKRSTDPRIRREVVGQMLDYAAHVTAYVPVDFIRLRFEQECEDPEERVRALLFDAVDGMDDAPDGFYEEFWSRVKSNLESGRLRLLFIADEVPTELRRVVEYLNAQMPNAEVLAVEIKQFTSPDQSFTIVVPTVLGQTARTLVTKAATHLRIMDETSFFQDVSGHGEDVLKVTREIYEWAKATGIRWNQASFSALDAQNRPLFAVHTSGKIEIYLQSYDQRPPFNQRSMKEQLVSRLREVGALNVDKPYSQIPLKHLKDEAMLHQFVTTFDWVRQQIAAVQLTS